MILTALLHTSCWLRQEVDDWWELLIPFSLKHTHTCSSTILPRVAESFIGFLVCCFCSTYSRMDSSVIGEGMSILHCVLSYHLPYAPFFSLILGLYWFILATFHISFAIKATDMADKLYIMERLMDGLGPLGTGSVSLRMFYWIWAQNYQNGKHDHATFLFSQRMMMKT